VEPPVHEVATISAATLPTRVLLETSFLCDALWGQWGLERDRAQLSWIFLQRAESRGVRMWVTPAIVQEAIFAFMKPDMRMEAAARVGRQMTWSEFKRNHPLDFAEAHAACVTVARHIRAMLRTCGIEEALPRIRVDAQATGRWVAACACWYLRRYPIEPADALHIACARVDGTRAIATNDLDLQAVRGFQYLAYRSAP